ncbi:MAG: hypothetical protein AABX25_01175 [Nanoarchaeota archaeon]
MVEAHEQVRNPRIILSGLEFKIGQSLQLRFVRPGTNPPYGYDASIEMSFVDAVYQDRKELWKNTHCRNPSPLPVEGLQVVFSEGTVLDFDYPIPRCRINGELVSYDQYIEAIMDGNGKVHYDRNGIYSGKPKLEIISLLDQVKNK